jgi:hypothetical protein
MAQGGNRQGARQLLGHLVTSDDEYLRRSAERSLAQLQALDEMDALTSVARQVHARTGAYPASLEALIAGTSLPSTDPAGRRYGYEPSRGMVSIAADSPLAPLPRVLAPLEPR